MQNANSFNICTRCGTPNSLSAKYCYQCGGQLKVPEEPIVCHKCNTINTGLANFCRNCGATLKVGSQTKICPCCNKEVPVEQSQCKCGYKFATVKVVNHVGNVTQVREDAQAAIPLNRKGGRVVAILSLIFLLIIDLIYALPTFTNIPLLNSICAIVNADGSVVFVHQYVTNIAQAIMSGTAISIADWTLAVVIIVMSLCVVVHMFSAIIRLFTNKKARKANYFYLTMFLLSAIAVALVAVASLGVIPADSFFAFVNVFALPAGATLGYAVMIVIPAYFLFFFIFSLFAKTKKARKV